MYLAFTQYKNHGTRDLQQNLCENLVSEYDQADEGNLNAYRGVARFSTTVVVGLADFHFHIS